MIDDTKVGILYYKIYGYGQAFRSVLGFLIMQVLLLCVYYTLSIITSRLSQENRGLL